MERTGLARALSKAGYCSRSSARKMIGEGRVRVNGRVVRDPEKPVALGRAAIEVDGKKIGATAKLYLMMNKLRGIVTSARDEKGRDTVYSLLQDQQWIAPVGRLDKASEGLLLLTNDSVWAAAITSPETHVEKTYHVQIATIADETLIKNLTVGISVRSDDRTPGGGRKAEDFLRVKRAAILRTGNKNSWLEIVLDEGKNRQIRRVLAEMGIEVLRLIRISIGPLEMGKLEKGKIRELTAEEKAALEPT